MCAPLHMRRMSPGGHLASPHRRCNCGSTPPLRASLPAPCPLRVHLSSQAPFWAKQTQRSKQAPCGLRITVQTDPKDNSTVSAVGVAGAAGSFGRVPVLNATVTCLLPGLTMTTFAIENPYAMPVTMRVGAPTLPWLVVSESDRAGFVVEPGSKKQMLVVADSSLYDNKNSIAEWMIVADPQGQTQVSVVLSSIPLSPACLPASRPDPFRCLSFFCPCLICSLRSFSPEHAALSVSSSSPAPHLHLWLSPYLHS